jgi:predicted PurR-regulated permease PerM
MNAEKVKPLHPEEDSTEEKKLSGKLPPASPKDMSKVAIVISILSVLLLVVFFFSMNQNLSGLSAKVENLSGMQNQIESIDSKVAGLEEEISGLENLPQQTRNMVLANSLQEMAQRTSVISSQVNTEEQSTKLQEAMNLLQEVQVELGTNSQ